MAGNYGHDHDEEVEDSQVQSTGFRVPVWAAAVLLAAGLAVPTALLDWLWNVSSEVNKTEIRVGMLERYATTSTSDHDLLQRMQVTLEGVSHRLDNLNDRIPR